MPGMVTVGVVALDNIRTPFGERKGILGGSATFSSFAASFFSDVGLVAIVGDDFPAEHLDLLKSRVCLRGLERKGKTFRWEGYYEGDMNSAVTIRTELNSFQGFNPVLPEEYRKSEYLFLANMDPALQMRVMGQMIKPKLIALDTMNYWIKSRPQELLEAIGMADVFLLNEGEARMLFKTQDPDKAAGLALAIGPRAVIIKKGSEGASLYTKSGRHDVPAIRLNNVIDPTGAGDSFAGGFVGYLAKKGNLSQESLKRALAYGTAMASFAVQGFSLETMKSLRPEEIEKRLEALK